MAMKENSVKVLNYLKQINGQDVTESIVNNRLTMKVNKNSNMIVLFDNKGYDVNDDGKVDISDVVKLVNVILVQ